MRVLTVRQPWAWAIVHGGKDVENRSRSLGPYRGLVAIHAGLTLDLDALDELSAGGHRALGDAILARTPEDLITMTEVGTVIGVVNLWAMHSAQPWCCPNLGVPPFGGPWAQPDHWHLNFTNPRPLAHPIPTRGRLGLWRPNNELAAAVRRQLEEAT